MVEKLWIHCNLNLRQVGKERISTGIDLFYRLTTGINDNLVSQPSPQELSSSIRGKFRAKQLLRATSVEVNDNLIDESTTHTVRIRPMSSAIFEVKTATCKSAIGSLLVKEVCRQQLIMNGSTLLSSGFAIISAPSILQFF